MNNLFSVLAILFIPFAAYSQDQKGTHEISICVGAGSPTGFSLGFRSTGASSNSEADYDKINSSSGPFFLSYKYFIGNNSAFGLSVGTQTITGSIKNDYNYFNGNFHYISTALMTEFTQNYTTNEKWRRYFLVGVGVAFDRTSYSYYPGLFGGNRNIPRDNGTFLAYQITPIGFKYVKRFGWFLELGYGYKGILNTGVLLKVGRLDNEKSEKNNWWR